MNALDQAVSRYAREGYTVTSRTDSQAVLQRKERVRWLLWLLLALLTAGILLIVPIFKAVNRRTETVVLTLTPEGRVTVATS